MEGALRPFDSSPCRLTRVDAPDCVCGCVMASRPPHPQVMLVDGKDAAAVVATTQGIVDALSAEDDGFFVPEEDEGAAGKRLGLRSFCRPATSRQNAKVRGGCVELVLRELFALSLRRGSSSTSGEEGEDHRRIRRHRGVGRGAQKEKGRWCCHDGCARCWGKSCSEEGCSGCWWWGQQRFRRKEAATEEAQQEIMSTSSRRRRRAAGAAGGPVQHSSTTTDEEHSVRRVPPPSPTPLKRIINMAVWGGAPDP